MTRLSMPFDNPATYPGHSGIDYGQPRGTAFRASDSGVVTWLGSNSRGGNFIWVQYDSIGPRVGYHHMDSHDGCPPVGARFAYGDRLGFVGNTGNSTGPHLHSEVDGFATTDGYWQFFDSSRVVGSGSAAGGSEVTPQPQLPLEDGNMQSVQVGGIIYGINNEFITHYGTVDQATITTNVYSATDEIHQITLEQFVALLDGSGIPQQVLDASGNVFNPQSGKHEYNGTWSRGREILAELAKR